MAQDDGFLLRIVSWRGVEVEKEVLMTLVPSTLGQLGFLPRHRDYAGVLEEGKVEYESEDGEKGSSWVTGGIITYKKEVLTVAADEVREKK